MVGPERNIDWRVEFVDNFILFNSQFNLVNNDVVCFVGVLDSEVIDGIKRLS